MKSLTIAGSGIRSFSLGARRTLAPLGMVLAATTSLMTLPVAAADQVVAPAVVQAAGVPDSSTTSKSVTTVDARAARDVTAVRTMGQSKVAAVAPDETEIPLLRGWMLAVLALLAIALGNRIKIRLSSTQRREHRLHPG